MKQHVIIGNSAAGIAAIESIRRRDKSAKIIVISDEDYPAYCRCLISYYLAGEVQEDKIVYRPESFYKDNNVELYLNKKVDRVEPDQNRVICADKSNFSYDYLLIATGARPKFLKLPGIEKRGVFGLRTIKDAQEIAGLLPVTKMACVLGGGLIGLKAAYALRKRDIAVKVIIKSRQILSQMLDLEAASLVQKRLEDNGIELLFGQDAQEIIGNDALNAVKIESGKVLNCSLVVSGKGVQPNIGLVKNTAVKVQEGIVANDTMQTSTGNIYAAGDVCESLDISTGKLSVNALWPVAVEQGKIAGANMSGERLVYDGSLGMNSIEFFGLPIISLGVYKTNDNSGFEELKIANANKGCYKKLILKGNSLVGAILVGDIKNSGVLLRLIREKTDVSSFKDKLLQDNFSYPHIINVVKEKEHWYV